MPCLCLGRICLNKVCPAHTLPVSGRVRPPLHTNGPPRDNCPGLQTVSRVPTVLPAAPVGPLCHTTGALVLHLCSRQRLHRAPWPDAAAPPRFPASRPYGSTLPLVPDRRPPQKLAHTKTPARKRPRLNSSH